MKDINIEAILNKYSIAKFGEPDKGKACYLNHTVVKAAIKEIVEAVIDKCSKEAEAYVSFTSAKINKESILRVKQQINYD